MPNSHLCLSCQNLRQQHRTVLVGAGASLSINILIELYRNKVVKPSPGENSKAWNQILGRMMIQKLLRNPTVVFTYEIRH